MEDVQIRPDAYPRWVHAPTDENPANEVLVQNQKDHADKFPTDYEAFLQEEAYRATPRPVSELIKEALDNQKLQLDDEVKKAVAEERLRCAQIAEKFDKAAAEAILAQ